MATPRILHMLTPLKHMSPFDVNMGLDAGFDHAIPYTNVTVEDVYGLVQDAIFSRGPEGIKRTAMFIGGKRAIEALDMMDRAKKAMVPPFEISVFADPAGSFTTAAAMVALALAFGITALLAPMHFQQVPRRILLVPVLAVLWLGALALDGELSRADGVLLLVGFVLALLYLTRLTRRGLDIRPGGEVAETLAEQGPVNRWQSLGLLLLSLAGIVVGSELLVLASQSLLEWLGLSDTVFGMTVLALAVSVEELARELPAAWQGRPEISFGNVAGSILAFFLCNAGVIALVRPIPVPAQVLWFYLPVCLGTVVVLSLVMLTLRVPRWAGGVLVALYLVFVAGGYLGYGLP